MFDRQALIAAAEAQLGAPVRPADQPDAGTLLAITSLRVLTPSERLLLIAICGWASEGRWMRRSEMLKHLDCKTESLKIWLKSLLNKKLIVQRNSTAPGLAPINYFYAPDIERIEQFFDLQFGIDSSPVDE